MTTSSPAPPRTTRRDKAEATRAALLDATIACLTDDGYDALTTRRVAERAGVSQGAQQHHFRTKSELVAAAANRLTDLVAAAYVDDRPPATSERAREADMVDRLWELHQTPITFAILEFLNAARTDQTIAADVAGLINHGSDRLFETAQKVIPALAGAPGYRDRLDTMNAVMRGAMLAKAVPGVAGIAEWPVLRSHILTILRG